MEQKFPDMLKNITKLESDTRDAHESGFAYSYSIPNRNQPISFGQLVLSPQ
jgi:hypothetical protein